MLRPWAQNLRVDVGLYLVHVMLKVWGFLFGFHFFGFKTSA